MTSKTKLAALGIAAALALAGCGSASNIEGRSDDTNSSDTLVIGSQDYYSNEIIAEIYAQSLEKSGKKVDRQLKIGQREVYMPELQAGKIDIFPEYSGNLLQYYKPETTARTPEQVHAELVGALPEGLKALEQASATDQDSYVVTKAFAEQYSLKQIGDLASVPDLKIAGNSELESRPYGPKGLARPTGSRPRSNPPRMQADHSPSRPCATGTCRSPISTPPPRCWPTATWWPWRTRRTCSCPPTWCRSYPRRWTTRPRRP